jgi:adiponectin receptor
MGLSAYFHLFNCQCATKFFYLQKLDFAGIAIMIAGSCTPPYYYGFLCE